MRLSAHNRCATAHNTNTRHSLESSVPTRSRMMAANPSSAGFDGKGSLGLTTAELRAVEATRFRLQNLSNSLASFKNDIFMNKPLPNPQSLQTSAGILKHHTTYLLDILNKHSLLFQRLAIRPSTNYPGRTQENVLMTLLRKKLEPEIETLVEAARDEALAAGISPTQSFISQERLLAEKERERAERRAAKFGGFAEESDDDEEDDDDDENGSGDDGLPEDEGGDRVNEPLGIGDVWVDSFRYCREQLKRFADEFGEDLYTAEERARGVENVRTGLKRSLEEEEEEDESDDEEEEGEESDEEGAGGDNDKDGEGDTAMKDMAPIAPSSGQPAGQAGVVGAMGAAKNGVGMGPSPGEDPEWMLAFVARGDEELPMAMLEAQRSQIQRR